MIKTIDLASSCYVLDSIPKVVGERLGNASRKSAQVSIDEELLDGHGSSGGPIKRMAERVQDEHFMFNANGARCTNQSSKRVVHAKVYRLIRAIPLIHDIIGPHSKRLKRIVKRYQLDGRIGAHLRVER